MESSVNYRLWYNYKIYWWLPEEVGRCYAAAHCYNKLNTWPNEEHKNDGPQQGVKQHATKRKSEGDEENGGMGLGDGLEECYWYATAATKYAN